MWTCHKCNFIVQDEAKEFCFECMTARDFDVTTVPQS